MLRISAATLLLFCLSAASAQRSNEFQIRLGYGIAAYKTENNLSYDLGSFSVTEDTTDGAATAHVPIELRYEITERFNAGLDLKFGNYLYEEGQQGNQTNGFWIAGAAGEFTAYNGEDARLYISLGLNTGRLELNDYGPGYTSRAIYKGGGFRVSGGFMFFFGHSPFGVNLNLGYDTHNFKLESLEFTSFVGGWTLDDFSGSLKVSGIELNGGIVFRIRS